MAGMIKFDAPEAEQAPFEQVNLLGLCDGLGDDKYGLRAIYLAVWGLQGSGIDARDLYAIGELVERAEERRLLRYRQANALRGAEAEGE